LKTKEIIMKEFFMKMNQELKCLKAEWHSGIIVHD